MTGSLLIAALIAVATLPAAPGIHGRAAESPRPHARPHRAASLVGSPPPPRTSCSADRPAGTHAYLDGIDVSNWDGAIDWTGVAGRGIVFAFAKATQGLSYDDPTYAANKSGAETQHIRFTAYEYMDPTGGTKRAVRDANHFLDVAALTDRNMVPVLDVERSSGYSPARLQKWMTAWLHRVYVRLGVRAIIYTAPTFWASALRDTTWFADHGYPLWIAHWGVDTPTVPASDWGGAGWTFWQWTDCGSVPGIAGDVDLDFYQGAHLHPMLIRVAKG